MKLGRTDQPSRLFFLSLTLWRNSKSTTSASKPKCKANNNWSANLSSYNFSFTSCGQRNNSGNSTSITAVLTRRALLALEISSKSRDKLLNRRFPCFLRQPDFLPKYTVEPNKLQIISFSNRFKTSSCKLLIFKLFNHFEQRKIAYCLCRAISISENQHTFPNHFITFH